MIKDTLSSQIKCYKKERDNIKKTKIAQSIGYLGQIVNSLISSQEEVGIKPEIPESAGAGITEKIIKEFVRYEILESGKDNETILKNELLQDIIKFKKCDLIYANLMYTKMEELGLEACRKYPYDNLQRFAIIHNYVTEEELGKLKKS